MKLLTALWRMVNATQCLICQQNVNQASICRDCYDLLHQEARGEQKQCKPCGGYRVTFYHVNHFHSFTKKLLIEFKYRHNHIAGNILCMYLKQWFQNCLELQTVDAVVAVPLHRWRYLWRGFNQALILATVTDKTKIVTPSPVLRTKYTKPQVKSNLLERKTQLTNVMQLKKSFKADHLLLVDDVLTTGATIDSIIALFNPNDVKKISVLTIC